MTNVHSTSKSSLLNRFTAQQHPFHILPNDALPFHVALFLLVWLIPQTLYLHSYAFPFRFALTHLTFLFFFVTVMTWFTRIVQESGQGYHTKAVQHGLRVGVILFIVSEVMLFFAFFWGFFHYSLAPAIAIGTVWPPVSVQVPSAWGLPLINTLLLLSSGVTITAAHAELLKGKVTQFGWTLFLTVVLGICFLICQGYEYTYGVDFSWRENIYGSIFFITTGFHGLHVTIGTLFLSYCLLRHIIATRCADFAPIQFARNQHIGFEAAAWYWHFVDVVWLFLFITVYWWGGIE